VVGSALYYGLYTETRLSGHLAVGRYARGECGKGGHPHTDGAKLGRPHTYPGFRANLYGRSDRLRIVSPAAEPGAHGSNYCGSNTMRATDYCEAMRPAHICGCLFVHTGPLEMACTFKNINDDRSGPSRGATDVSGNWEGLDQDGAKGTVGCHVELAWPLRGTRRTRVGCWVASG